MTSCKRVCCSNVLNLQSKYDWDFPGTLRFLKPKFHWATNLQHLEECDIMEWCLLVLPFLFNTFFFIQTFFLSTSANITEPLRKKNTFTWNCQTNPTPLIYSAAINRLTYNTNTQIKHFPINNVQRVHNFPLRSSNVWCAAPLLTEALSLFAFYICLAKDF